MSRIEEDRDAARRTEQLAAQKKADEAKKLQGQATNNAFSKLVQASKEQGARK